MKTPAPPLNENLSYYCTRFLVSRPFNPNAKNPFRVGVFFAKAGIYLSGCCRLEPTDMWGKSGYTVGDLDAPVKWGGGVDVMDMRNVGLESAFAGGRWWWWWWWWCFVLW